MSARRKKLTVAGCAALALAACFWFYWSPRAEIKGHFSTRDHISIRWLVRMETFEPILQIIEQPDGTVMVWTGKQTAPLAGGGQVFTLVRTNGWKVTERAGWVSQLSNERPGADAGWRVLFAFGSPWSLAAQAERWNTACA